VAGCCCVFTTAGSTLEELWLIELKVNIPAMISIAAAAAILNHNTGIFFSSLW
jgi:hypothetical protein